MTFVPKLGGGVNCRNIGIENEQTILKIIDQQGWVRELELSLLSGFGIDKVELICRRLASRKQITRKRIYGDAGFFLRLYKAGADRIGGMSGKDIVVPKSWRHDAVAVQALHNLSNYFNLSKGIITEAKLRREFGEKGKIPDGKLHGVKLHFEQEWSRKSGPQLATQVEKVVDLAKQGFMCIIAYPYPAEYCGSIDHELRQSNSIRDRIGDQNLPIQMLRCHFDSCREFNLARVSRFELIALPESTKSRSEKQRSGQKIKEPKEPNFFWKTPEMREDGYVIIYQLLRDGVEVVELTFRRGRRARHSATYRNGDRIIATDPFESFDEFVEETREYILQLAKLGELPPDCNVTSDASSDEEGGWYEA